MAAPSSHKESITIMSTILAEKDPIASEMANEVAILDPRSGMYFGLDNVGATVWRLIQNPIRVSDIRNEIIKEYDVACDRCEKDILGVLEAMWSHRLITVKDETNE